MSPILTALLSLLSIVAPGGALTLDGTDVLTLDGTDQLVR